ncbi:MAG: antitoxin [Chloroflexi bacterium RBG_19FT_COMBO_56_12]|nr:MAG: antitoxin [Chloroflexi bacterium RBG_19FT_COMBO_56_12]
MRTTIRIDDQLLREAKQLAARTGQSLTSVIEDALREVLARQREPGKRKPVRLTTFTGRGPLPGVDLDDSAALLDLMESAHDPH